MKRRNFLKLFSVSLFGILLKPLNAVGLVKRTKKSGLITEFDIVPGNIFMRDVDGFPEVILQCNAPIEGRAEILYMLGGVHGNPLAPYTEGGIIGGNEYMCRKRKIDPENIAQRIKQGITGYTAKEMVRVLNYDGFKLVGSLRYKWPTELKRRLHGTKYFENNPTIDKSVLQ